MADPTKLSFAVPKYANDKIIGIFSGSMTGSGTGYDEEEITTGFGDTCLTRCLYSLNGGDLNDDGMGVPGIQGITFTAASFSRTNTVGIAAQVMQAGATLDYSIYAYAKSNQGVVTPVSTNQKLSYASKFNYEKIAFDGIYQMVISSYGLHTYTFTHNLGYVPDTKCSLEYASESGGGGVYPVGTITPLCSRMPYNYNDANKRIVTGTLMLTDTTAVFMLYGGKAGISLTLNIHYRIYHED